MKACVIFVAADRAGDIKKITDALLKDRSAACVNVVGPMSSVYRWKGKIEKASEKLMIIKAPKSNVKKIISTVKKLHSYETPEIIALDIADGYAGYIKWIFNETHDYVKQGKKQY
ncbi:MAG: divalent-cation tolerance protein CutA [Candidatus Goldiibacteriota bacterium]